MRLAGVELYSEDLERARDFYQHVLGLEMTDERFGHHVRFTAADAFLCIEAPGAEEYPSRDKAVLFFEVENLAGVVERLGRDRFVKVEPGWAVLHDPDGHNVLLLQKGDS
jgi:catechol 2,3-dioxygenase-like lactoylglutathione lyase family enzyme